MTSTNSIDYEVANNRHTLAGARAALELSLISMPGVTSLLDVGCGPGTWVRAAGDLGIPHAMGIDGRLPDLQTLTCNPNAVQQIDLTTPWSLGRKFDLVLCLEVAEHLPADLATNLVQRLCAHGDDIFFSAAIPGQGGQHHVNCQWPDYWQRLFNEQGFACFDSLRWRIWDNDLIEPWYRQNLFHAQRSPGIAGEEATIPRVIHPAMLAGILWEETTVVSEVKIRQIEEGSQRVIWYPLALCKALWCKVVRHI